MFFVTDYRMKFLCCAHCALLLLLKDEKYWPVFDSVAVFVIDAFMISLFYGLMNIYCYRLSDEISMLCPLRSFAVA